MEKKLFNYEKEILKMAGFDEDDIRKFEITAYNRIAFDILRREILRGGEKYLILKFNDINARKYGVMELIKEFPHYFKGYYIDVLNIYPQPIDIIFDDLKEGNIRRIFLKNLRKIAKKMIDENFDFIFIDNFFTDKDWEKKYWEMFFRKMKENNKGIVILTELDTGKMEIKVEAIKDIERISLI